MMMIIIMCQFSNLCLSVCLSVCLHVCLCHQTAVSVRRHSIQYDGKLLQSFPRWPDRLGDASSHSDDEAEAVAILVAVDNSFRRRQARYQVNLISIYHTIFAINLQQLNFSINNDKIILVLNSFRHFLPSHLDFEQFLPPSVLSGIFLCTSPSDFHMGAHLQYGTLGKRLRVVDRVVMCLMCGDDYKVDVPLSPLLNHQFYHINKSDDAVMSVTLETYLDEFKRRVEVVTSSYHSSSQLKDFLYHGYLLVFSAKRKASLATLR